MTAAAAAINDLRDIKALPNQLACARVCRRDRPPMPAAEGIRTLTPALSRFAVEGTRPEQLRRRCPLYREAGEGQGEGVWSDRAGERGWSSTSAATGRGLARRAAARPGRAHRQRGVEGK